MTSTPFRGKRPASVGNACLEAAHAKTTLIEGRSSFAWVSHGVDLNLANFVIYSVVVILYNHKLLDLHLSRLIIRILYNMKQLQEVQTIPFLKLCLQE